MFKVSEDLILEVWPGESEGDRALLKLRSLSLERDAEAPGVVIIFPEEIRPLQAALEKAAAVLEEEQ